MEQIYDSGYEKKMAKASENIRKMEYFIRQKWPDIKFEIQDLPNEFVVQVAESKKIQHFTKVDPFVLIDGGIVREVPLEVAVFTAIFRPHAESFAEALHETEEMVRGVAKKLETGQN